MDKNIFAKMEKQFTSPPLQPNCNHPKNKIPERRKRTKSLVFTAKKAKIPSAHFRRESKLPGISLQLDPTVKLPHTDQRFE